MSVRHFYPIAIAAILGCASGGTSPISDTVHGKATHGSEYATVYVDGQRYGSVESLRNIQAYQVADIRYYDITQAGARFGVQGGTAGVIEVRIRTR